MEAVRDWPMPALELLYTADRLTMSNFVARKRLLAIIESSAILAGIRMLVQNLKVPPFASDRLVLR